jgi:hypothetical protein
MSEALKIIYSDKHKALLVQKIKSSWNKQNKKKQNKPLSSQAMKDNFQRSNC